MPSPFGHSLQFELSLARSGLSLGPGWAMLAGALSAGQLQFESSLLGRLFLLWLLVDPILGTLWELLVQRGLWGQVKQAELPPPAHHGFSLPYAQPGSVAGRLALRARRYQRWWRETFGPQSGRQVMAAALGSLLALLLAIFLSSTILWLALLAIGLTLLAAQSPPDLSSQNGGRLQAVTQFLLPWAMGASLTAPLSPFSLLLGLCFWATYLGGLRMLGQHQRAGSLFFWGQIAAAGLLLALRSLPGAAIISLMLIAQQIIKTKFTAPADFLPKVQLYLIVAVIVAAFSVGNWLG